MILARYVCSKRRSGSGMCFRPGVCLGCGLMISEGRVDEDVLEASSSSSSSRSSSLCRVCCDVRMAGVFSEAAVEGLMSRRGSGWCCMCVDWTTDARSEAMFDAMVDAVWWKRVQLEKLALLSVQSQKCSIRGSMDSCSGIACSSSSDRLLGYYICR